jgi:hypothetical protein
VPRDVIPGRGLRRPISSPLTYERSRLHSAARSSPALGGPQLTNALVQAAECGIGFGAWWHPLVPTMVHTSVHRPASTAAVSETNDSETLRCGVGIQRIRPNQGRLAGGILKRCSRPVNARWRHSEHLGSFTHREPLHSLQIVVADSFAATSQSLALASSPREPRVNAFSNPFALELREAAQDAQHEPPSGATGVDALAQ